MTTEDESIIGAGNSTKNTSEKRRRIEDSKTSVLMAVPENTSIVLKGSQEIAGNIMIQNGRKTVKIASAVRRTYRESKKAKEFRVLTEEEKQEREKEQEKRRQEKNQARWAAREEQRGSSFTEEQHTAIDLEEKEEMIRKGNAAINPDTKMAPLSAFFVKRTSIQEAQSMSGISVNDSDVQLLESLQTSIVAEPDVEPNPTVQGQAFCAGMHVYLRLAFIEKEKVDKMQKKHASVHIKRKGIIGKEMIKEMIAKDIAKLDLVEFGKLNSFENREAGRDVSRSSFSELKKILEGANGDVNIKYLIKQNRKQGENHKWTDKQINIIKKAVEDAKTLYPTAFYSKAAENLNARHNGTIGNICKKQVANVYTKKV